jgi:DNA-binding MarR family transcriptional regulator
MPDSSAADRTVPERSTTERPSPDRALLDGVVLRDTPGHLLRRAQQRAIDLYWQSAGEDGLRPPQFAVLITVYQNPGLNQTALVQKTGIDRSTVGDMIARLAKKGLLERRRVEADQRANTLWITGAGIDALLHTAGAALAAQNDIMAPIPPEARAAFIENLRRLADLPADAATD